MASTASLRELSSSFRLWSLSSLAAFVVFVAGYLLLLGFHRGASEFYADVV